jgi:hypothetical protein
MDQKMPLKLPRYMFRRANGSFRYKRNVPKDLRRVIPKATVYRQLGNTYQDALRALPKVHAEIEILFDRERRTTDEKRATVLVRERLGERHQSMFIDGAVDPEWPEYDDFQELAEDVEHAVPKGITRQLRAASSEAAPMSLSRVLEEYYTYKAEESDNGLRTRIDRLRKDLILCLGKNRFEWTELKDLTRADANSYRDLLLARMAPNSVQRNLGVVKAAINHVLLEQIWISAMSSRRSRSRGREAATPIDFRSRMSNWSRSHLPLRAVMLPAAFCSCSPTPEPAWRRSQGWRPRMWTSIKPSSTSAPMTAGASRPRPPPAASRCHRGPQSASDSIKLGYRIPTPSFPPMPSPVATTVPLPC